MDIANIINIIVGVGLLLLILFAARQIYKSELTNMLFAMLIGLVAGVVIEFGSYINDDWQTHFFEVCIVPLCISFVCLLMYTANKNDTTETLKNGYFIFAMLALAATGGGMVYVYFNHLNRDQMTSQLENGYKIVMGLLLGIPGLILMFALYKAWKRRNGGSAQGSDEWKDEAYNQHAQLPPPQAASPSPQTPDL